MLDIQFHISKDLKKFFEIQWNIYDPLRSKFFSLILSRLFILKAGSSVWIPLLYIWYKIMNTS